MRAGKAAISLALIGAALLGGAGVLEASASTPAGGHVQLFSNPTLSGASGSVLIAGASGDHGKYVQVNAAGTPDPNGSYAKISLHNGTFEVKFTAATVLHKTPFKATCSGIAAERTPSVVLNGTGQYAGISGNLTSIPVDDLAPGTGIDQGGAAVLRLESCHVDPHSVHTVLADPRAVRQGHRDPSGE